MKNLIVSKHAISWNLFEGLRCKRTLYFGICAVIVTSGIDSVDQWMYLVEASEKITQCARFRQYSRFSIRSRESIDVDKHIDH